MGERGLEAERIEDHRAIARAMASGSSPIRRRAGRDHAQQSTFTRRDMAMFAHRHSDGKEQFDQVMSAVRGSPDLVALGKDGRGEDRFTTREMIETEQRLHRASELMAERSGIEVEDRGREGALARAATARPVLSGEQRDAFEHVTDGRGLGVVVGYAGTGKSAMLGVAREAWEGAGYTVRGAALSGIAAENLESGSGIASRTIASMEHGWGRAATCSPARDVLVIDEAGMVGTRQMERVLSHAAEAGAKGCAGRRSAAVAGHRGGRGVPSIHERHGGVEISEVRRQREDWQRTPRGSGDRQHRRCDHAYDEHGMVHAAETREQARGELIDRWDRDRQASPG
jgi:ATP-dependent exoDNAse (exonuclease V) alpha subunit